jgi:predicted acyltransferase
MDPATPATPAERTPPPPYGGTGTAVQEPPPRPPADRIRPERLRSLDAFRGITIAGMLLVNNPGTWSAIHPPLRHAEWHGWTPTDLIFPFFLFIVGVSITFSFAARVAQGAERTDLMLSAVRRSAILFGLGLFLHAFPNFFDLSTLRIPGVLQRIAIVYLIAAALVLHLRRRGQIAATVLLLLGYWAAMVLVPVPGGEAGSLEPGRDLGAWIDRAVFGEAHLWKSSRTWDPEGLFSTLPAVATTLLGVFTGLWLRSPRSALQRAGGLLAAGAAGVAVGLAWDQAFPINKPLWTSSYVVFTAGLACWFLAACYWLIDIRGWRRWALPFTVFGVNAIAAFFLSSLFARVITLIRVGPEGAQVTLKGWFYANAVVPLFDRPENASLAFALCFVLFWLGLMTILYRRRIFIKV